MPALSKILIFHSDTMQTAPRLIQSGSGWADMEARPSDRIKITGKDAAMLIKSGFLQRTDEFGTETLICTMKLHEILRAMGLCGYRSRSEEHTSELQSLMRISYAVFCLKQKTRQ